MAATIQSSPRAKQLSFSKPNPTKNLCGRDHICEYFLQIRNVTKLFHFMKSRVMSYRTCSTKNLGSEAHNLVHLTKFLGSRHDYVENIDVKSASDRCRENWGGFDNSSYGNHRQYAQNRYCICLISLCNQHLRTRRALLQCTRDLSMKPARRTMTWVAKIFLNAISLLRLFTWSNVTIIYETSNNAPITK